MPRLPLPAASLAALFLAACAQAAPPLHAGEWEVKSGAAGQPTVAYRLCMKSGGAEGLQLLLPQVKGGGACPAPKVREEAGNLWWELDCPAAELAVRARYTVQAEQVQGDVDILSGNPPQRRADHISASYAGPCAGN